MQVIGKTTWIKNLSTEECSPSSSEDVFEAEALLVCVPGAHGRCGDWRAMYAFGEPEDERRVNWCHQRLVAEGFKETLGRVIPEAGPSAHQFSLPGSGR